MKTVLWTVVLVGAPTATWGQARPGEGWEMHPMWGVWGMWGAGMLLFMVLFWGLVIVGLVLAIRWLLHQGREPRADTALETLRQRYARGEIDREEFLAKKRDL